MSLAKITRLNMHRAMACQCTNPNDRAESRCALVNIPDGPSDGAELLRFGGRVGIAFGLRVLDELLSVLRIFFLK